KLNQEKVLELQDGVVDSPGQDGRLSNGHNLEDKEITALCWASSNGTLSSAERKLPVIVLHWLPNSKSQNDYDGQLFVYGGGEIGSEEVLTVLTLEWSARMKTLRCVGRAELTLSGSFSDMRLLLSTRNNHGADLLKQPQGEGPKCSACFQIFDSPVQALHYVDDGAKLAVSCECGRVAVLDMDAFSVSFVYNGDHVKSPKGARPISDLDKPVNNCKLVQLKKDTTAISMHVIEGNTSVVEPMQQKESPKFNERCCSKKEPPTEVDQPMIKHLSQQWIHLYGYSKWVSHFSSASIEFLSGKNVVDSPLDRVLTVVRVLGMAELKVSLTKAYNEDNKRKKQMSKSLAGEASTTTAAPKCCLSNVLVLKEVSHYCLRTRKICAASVYYMLLMQDLMLRVVISYVNAAIDTTAIGFKRS
ncbi:synaptobrevin, WD40/YVTN repeat-like-containing domain protein, partial [Tanacetum coccineum]